MVSHCLYVHECIAGKVISRPGVAGNTPVQNLQDYGSSQNTQGQSSKINVESK